MEISAEIASRYILEKSHLTPATKTNNIIQILEDLLGLHATNNTTPYISLHCRGSDLRPKQLHEVLYESKNIGKIRCIRGTVFFQYKSLIPFMHIATLKSREKQTQKRLDYNHIAADMLTAFQDKLIPLLRNNPMTTKEIRAKMNTSVDLSSMLFYLCDIGTLIRSKPRNNWTDQMHTYELFEEALPNVDLNSSSEYIATQEIILRYITQYGPVCEDDIVWWTGFNKIPVRESLRNLEDHVEIIDIPTSNQAFYILSRELDVIKTLRPFQESIINILPCLDPYIMGYKLRDRYIETDNKDYIFDRSGNATNVITLNGKIIGIWDWEIKESQIKYFVFDDLHPNQKQLMGSELKRIGRFLFETPFFIKEKSNMEPLTNRTAGWVLKPLRD